MCLLLWLDMPYLVGIPGKPALFWRGRRKNGSGEDARCWERTGRTGRRGNCSRDGIVERIKEKEKYSLKVLHFQMNEPYMYKASHSLNLLQFGNDRGNTQHTINQLHRASLWKDLGSVMCARFTLYPSPYQLETVCQYLSCAQSSQCTPDLTN